EYTDGGRGNVATQRSQGRLVHPVAEGLVTRRLGSTRRQNDVGLDTQGNELGQKGEQALVGAADLLRERIEIDDAHAGSRVFDGGPPWHQEDRPDDGRDLRRFGPEAGALEHISEPADADQRLRKALATRADETDP